MSDTRHLSTPSLCQHRMWPEMHQHSLLTVCASCSKNIQDVARRMLSNHVRLGTLDGESKGRTRAESLNLTSGDSVEAGDHYFTSSTISLHQAQRS
jgi:hypothetical protein